MTARAGRGQLPLHRAPPRLHRALAVRDLPARLAPFHPTPLVVVVWGVGTVLAVDCAVQAPQGFRIDSHLRAERLEYRLLRAHHGQRAGSAVKPNDASSQVMRGFW
jgi:hypothetical protein